MSTRDDSVEGVASRYCSCNGDPRCGGCRDRVRLIRAERRRAVRLVRQAANLLIRDESFLTKVNNGAAYRLGRAHVEASATRAILGPRKRKA